MFALDSHLTRHPPDSRMVEEQYLYERLQHVDEIIVAKYVSEFMREQCAHSLRLKPYKSLRGEKNQRTKPADYSRNFHKRRLAKPHGARDANLPSKRIKNHLPPCERWSDLALQCARLTPTADESDEQKRDARQPCQHKIRRDSIQLGFDSAERRSILLIQKAVGLKEKLRLPGIIKRSACSRALIRRGGSRLDRKSV